MRLRTQLYLIAFAAHVLCIAGPAAGQCDPKLTPADKHGYSKRLDNPDQCCEGSFLENVSGHSAPHVSVLEFSSDERVKTLTSNGEWRISWPLTPKPPKVQGRHKVLDRKYQIDPEPAKAPEGGVVPNVFRWRTDRAAQVGAVATDILFGVCLISSHDIRASAPAWDRLPPPQTPVFIPAKLEDKDAKTQPPSDKFGVNLVANVALVGVRIEAVRLGPAGDILGREPIAKDKELGPEASFFRLPPWKRDGSLVRLDIWCRQNGREDKLLPIYLQLPLGDSIPGATP